MSQPISPKELYPDLPKELWIKHYYPGTLCWETEVTVMGPVDWKKDPDNWSDFNESIRVVEGSEYDRVVRALDLAMRGLKHYREIDLLRCRAADDFSAFIAAEILNGIDAILVGDKNEK